MSRIATVARASELSLGQAGLPVIPPPAREEIERLLAQSVGNLNSEACSLLTRAFDANLLEDGDIRSLRDSFVTGGPGTLIGPRAAAMSALIARIAAPMDGQSRNDALVLSHALDLPLSAEHREQLERMYRLTCSAVANGLLNSIARGTDDKASQAVETLHTLQRDLNRPRRFASAGDILTSFSRSAREAFAPVFDNPLPPRPDAWVSELADRIRRSAQPPE